MTQESDVNDGQGVPKYEIELNGQVHQFTAVEMVRLRPQMYIGSTDRDGLYNLFYIILDNSIQEVMNGFCSEVTVTLHDEKTITVEDNGRGIPILEDPDSSVSYLEQVMTGYQLHGNGRAYRPCAGVHGGALFGVSALSSLLVAEVHRDGTHYRMQFSRGVPLGDLEVLGASDRQGTMITFTPDPDIFDSDIYYLPELLCGHLNELACLNPEATLRFNNLTNGDSMTFHQPMGIRRLIEYRERLSAYSHENPVIYGCVDKDGNRVEIAFEQQVWGECRVRSFVNSTELLGDIQDSFVPARVRLTRACTPGRAAENLSSVIADINHPELDSGPVMTGFLLGVRQVLVDCAVARGADAGRLEKIELWDVIEGLNAVVSLRLPEPIIDGPMHSKLAPSEEIECLVKELTIKMMSQFCEQYPEEAEQVLNRIVGIKYAYSCGILTKWNRTFSVSQD